MKSQDKPKYVSEARNLFESLDLAEILKDPNDLAYIGKINRLIAIFTNFSSNDGEELRRLLQEFQKTSRRSTSTGTIRNRAVDLLQFIGQKIEEMDIYEIDDSSIIPEQKIVKNIKNDKLWARSSFEGKDLHIQVGDRNSGKGEHAHFISDSRTGEIRIDANDEDPQRMIDRVVSVVTRNGPTIGISQQGVRTTMEFLDSTAVVPSSNSVPVLYATGIRHSGGPTGHFDLITIKNIGKEIALDVHWGMRAFAYEWLSKDEPFELEPRQEKEISFPISAESIFTNPVRELNIIMEYKDANGRAYFTRRELEQFLVPSKAFFNLRAGNFHPPSNLIDDGLTILSEPFSDGDRDEMLFGITVNGEEKKVKIGMSRSLSSVLGFDNNDKIKQAILELAHRKIRKMVEEDSISDHMFSTHELPDSSESPFERYLKLRDSI